MILRPALATDAEALAGVHGASFAAPWPAADIAALIGGYGALALVAEAAGIQGFILARAIGEQAEILTLAVAPSRRRRGVARALVEAASARAQAAGAETMFLEVAQDNAAALALYAALGFTMSGARAGYYVRPGGRRVDALVLSRALNTRPS